MTKREAAIIELYTNTCMLKGEDRKYIYEYAEKLTGRPIFTDELPYVADAYNDKIRDDFIEICKNTDDKHGKWILTGDEQLDNVYFGNKCSECKFVYCGDFLNYCPNCGAKMDKE